MKNYVNDSIAIQLHNTGIIIKSPYHIAMDDYDIVYQPHLMDVIIYIKEHFDLCLDVALLSNNLYDYAILSTKTFFMGEIKPYYVSSVSERSEQWCDSASKAIEVCFKNDFFLKEEE